MRRIFSILAALSTLMILIAAGSAYLILSASARDTEDDALSLVATSVAHSIDVQLNTLQQSVDGIAQSAEVINALASGNSNQIQATEAKLQHLVPYSLRVRLLLPNISDPDQSVSPHMGFGDLEMVRATLSSRPKPVIQGEGEHRHLAITSAVQTSQQVVGVILVSLESNVPQTLLTGLVFDHGRIELKQDQVMLASIGASSMMDAEPRSIALSNGRWQVHFWASDEDQMGRMLILSIVVGISWVCAGMIFFITYRKLTGLLRQDQSSVLNAAKDIMQGKQVGHYPLQLDEMIPMVTSLAQFKRVLSQDTSLIDQKIAKDRDFFDESFDIDFLEDGMLSTVPVQTAPSPNSTSMPNPSEVVDHVGATKAGGEPRSNTITFASFDEVATFTVTDEFTENIVSNSHKPDGNKRGSTEKSQSASAADVATKATPSTKQDDPVFTEHSSFEMDDVVSESMMPDAWQLDSFATPSSTTTQEPDMSAVFSPARERHAESIFREALIRGRVGENLTEDVMTRLGGAFATEAKQLSIKNFVVAHDSRPSSQALNDALIAGLTSAGCDVLDIGLVPTSVLYFVAHHTEGRSGIMVTGGGAADDFNGLKWLLNDEMPHAQSLSAVKRRVENDEIHRGEAASVERNHLFSNEYVGLIGEEAHIVRPMRIVLDCAFGAASHIGPMLLKTIGCDVIELNCVLDERLPQLQSDTMLPESCAALAQAVKSNEADLGLYLPGDASRLLVVDSAGRPIWPDKQMMLFAWDVLASKTGGQVLYDAGFSKYVSEYIKKRGGRPVLCKSNQAMIRTILKQTGAALAGTCDGHIFFNDRWLGYDDALYAAVRLIEVLSADMRSSAEVFDELPSSVITPEWSISLDNGDATRFMRLALEKASFDARIDNSDGLKVEFHDGWGLMRSSTTSAMLRVRFEADTSEALKRIQNQFKTLMLSIESDLILPF